MYVSIRITAVANRDKSCNLLTFSETHDFDYHNQPTPAVVKDLCKEHKVKFLDMWPHNGTAKPTLIPLDVDVRVKEGRRP